MEFRLKGRRLQTWENDIVISPGRRLTSPRRGKNLLPRWRALAIPGTIDRQATDMAKQYAICTIPRTGSSLLCDYLRNARTLGEPGEFFNPKVIQDEYFNALGLPTDALPVERYVRWLKATYTSANGVFGFKIMYYQFEKFRSFPAFRELFHDSRIFWLTRRSKVRQAVSYHIAQSTDHWIPQDERSKPLVAGRLAFDFDRINALLGELIEEEQAWLTIFECLELDYRTLVYEDFVENPRAFIHELAEEMGISSPGLPIASAWGKQHEKTSEEFYRQYKARAKEVLNSDRAESEHDGISMTP
jgi:trehalose 2-sulfotransferase